MDICTHTEIIFIIFLDTEINKICFERLMAIYIVYYISYMYVYYTHMKSLAYKGQLILQMHVNTDTVSENFEIKIQK